MWRRTKNLKIFKVQLTKQIYTSGCKSQGEKTIPIFNRNNECLHQSLENKHSDLISQTTIPKKHPVLEQKHPEHRNSKTPSTGNISHRYPQPRCRGLQVQYLKILEDTSSLRQVWEYSYLWYPQRTEVIRKKSRQGIFSPFGLK